MTAPALPPSLFEVVEQGSGQCTAVIVGNDGVTPISSAVLLTLTLSLYVIKQDGTDQIVNSRNVQNVLNANNVTVDTAGNLTWTYQAADTTLVEEIPFERHIAIFAWTWPAGAGRKEILLNVRNLHRIA